MVSNYIFHLDIVPFFAKHHVESLELNNGTFVDVLGELAAIITDQSS
jgi:hypothetical protein